MRITVFCQLADATKIMFIGTFAIFFLIGTPASAIRDAVDSVTAPVSLVFEKHPLEDSTSWKFHQERISAKELSDSPESSRRNLQTAALAVRGSTPEIKVIHQKNEHEDEPWELPFEITHKKQKKHVPFAGGDTTHGIMIDAGSVSVVAFRSVRQRKILGHFLSLISTSITSHSFSRETLKYYIDVKTQSSSKQIWPIARNSTSHIRVGQALSSRPRRSSGTIKGKIALIPDLKQSMDRQIYPGTRRICTIRGRSGSSRTDSR